MSTSHVLCIGEILWDSLPEGLFLGGAPLNVAAGLVQWGIPALMASAVGDDQLGREIIRRVKSIGLPTASIQIHHRLPTGFVRVTLDAQGSPTFDIVAPSAWDEIEARADLLQVAEKADAVVFGSLVQRSPVSRETILAVARAASLCVFDINLRPPFVDRAVVQEGLRLADVVKLNIDELTTLAEWFGLDDEPADLARRLANDHSIATICVTRGAAGAFLIHHDHVYTHPGCPVSVADAVGAGDAFLASLLHSILSDGLSDPSQSLARANATGAYVASRRGATPQLDHESILKLMNNASGNIVHV